MDASTVWVLVVAYWILMVPIIFGPEIGEWRCRRIRAKWTKIHAQERAQKWARLNRPCEVCGCDEHDSVDNDDEGGCYLQCVMCGATRTGDDE